MSVHEVFNMISNQTYRERCVLFCFQDIAKVHARCIHLKSFTGIHARYGLLRYGYFSHDRWKPIQYVCQLRGQLKSAHSCDNDASTTTAAKASAPMTSFTCSSSEDNHRTMRETCSRSFFRVAEDETLEKFS